MTDPSGSGDAGGPQFPKAAGVAVKILVTLFTLPFFVVGFFLLFGGGFVGDGAPGFVRLFGLAFMAVPAIMVIGVWSAKPAARGPASPASGPADRRSEAGPASVAVRSCEYCGRDRPADHTVCPSCGAK